MLLFLTICESKMKKLSMKKTDWNIVRNLIQKFELSQGCEFKMFYNN